MYKPGVYIYIYSQPPQSLEQSYYSLIIIIIIYFIFFTATVLRSEATTASLEVSCWSNHTH